MMFSLDDLLLHSKQAVPTEKYRYFSPINIMRFTLEEKYFSKAIPKKTGGTKVVEISHVALASVKRV
jgi:hypothetical protein